MFSVSPICSRSQSDSSPSHPTSTPLWHTFQQLIKSCVILGGAALGTQAITTLFGTTETPDSNCATSVALGSATSVLSGNPAPLAISFVACLPTAEAQTCPAVQEIRFAEKCLWNASGSDTYFNTGNVGIGTTSPVYSLDVAGAARITGAFTSGAITTTGLTSSGNVGIGTTSPAYPLDVTGSAHVTSNVIVDGKVGIGTTSPQAPLHVKGSGTGIHALIETNTGGYGTLTWRDGSNDRFSMYLDPTNRDMVFYSFSDSLGWITSAVIKRSNGYVGIGTSSPQAQLHVKGDQGFTDCQMVIDSVSATGESDLQWRQNGQLRASIQVASNSNFEVHVYRTDNAWYLVMEIDRNVGSVHFYNSISTSGSIGIGTSVPSEKLHVVGNIYASGTITAGGGACACTSDRRLKTDIEPIQGALETVRQFHGVTYRRSDSDVDRVRMGFIAQDVEEVFPGMVYTANNKKKTKSLDYGQMSALLVEAVKELEQKFEAKFNAVKERVAILESEHKKDKEALFQCLSRAEKKADL